MDVYSNLNVKGKITQKQNQADTSLEANQHDVVIVSTLNGRVPSTIPQPNQAGKAIVVNDQGTGYTLGEAGKVDGVKLGTSDSNPVTLTNKYAIISVATENSLGVVQIGTNIGVTNSGVISVNTASKEQIGVVKVGNNISVAANGTISLTSSDVTTALGSTIETGDSLSNDPTKIPSSHTVWKAIDALPEPMIFKGTVGSGGTISYANTASDTYRKEGWTYKAISDGTVNTNTSVSTGDTIIFNGTEWIVIPSGDEPSGTVTSIAPGTGLTTSDLNPGSSGGPITGSGTIGLANTSVTAGSYGPSGDATIYDLTLNIPSFTVDAQGRLTSASNNIITIADRFSATTVLITEVD